MKNKLFVFTNGRSNKMIIAKNENDAWRKLHKQVIISWIWTLLN